MLKLEKIFKVWDNLEDSYSKYCKSNKYITRKAYLKELLAYEDDIPNLTVLRSILGEEISTYDDTQMQQYTALFDKFERIAESLNTAEVIKNLDEYCSGDFEQDAVEEELSLEDYKIFKHDAYTSIENAIVDRVFGNYVSRTGDEYYIDVNGDLFKYFKTQTDVALYIYNYKNGRIAKTEFNNTVYLVAMYLVRNHYKIEDFCIVAPELVLRTTRSIKLGKTTVKLKDTIAVSDANYSEAPDCSITGISFNRCNVTNAAGLEDDVIFVR